MSKVGILVLVICIDLLPSLLQARVYQSSFLMSQFQKKEGWIYLDKITFERGMANVKVEMKVTGLSKGGISNSTTLLFTAIPEYNWAEEQKLQCQKETINGDIRAVIKLSPPKQPKQEGEQQTMDNTSLVIDLQDDTMYYFVLKDCAKNLGADYNNMQMKLFVRITTEHNGKYVGAQQDHWYIIPIIIGAGMWLVFYNKDVMAMGGETHWAKMMLFMGIATNISSLTWKTFGFIIYSMTGSDYLLFHIIYLIMHSVSECFVIGLIIFIAYGWSINFIKGKDLEVIVPVSKYLSITVVLVAFLNIVTTVLTKINNKQHDRHHMFDSIPGILLISFRALMLIPFLAGVVITYRSSRHRVKEFIIKFAVLGFLYISALPIIWLWADNNIAQKNQNEFVFVAVESVKTICNIMLTYTISYKKSQYQSVAYSNTSFIPESQTGFR